jgi:prophage antirepressor-like protein
MEEKLIIRQFNNINIEIYGTYEEPLFKSQDISGLFGIEKNDDMLFLTDDDLDEILFTLQTPEAKEFRVWVRNIIKEIRKKGKDELEAKIKEKDQLLEHTLKKYQELVYEEINKPETVYVFTTDIVGVYKIGKTMNINARKSSSNTLLVYDIQTVYEHNTNCARLVEEIVHYILDHYRSNSNRELFRCDINYIKKIINIVANTVDTLKSSYQTISHDQLFSILNEKITTNYKPSKEPYHTNKLYKWLDDHIEAAGPNDYVDLKTLCERFLDKEIVQPRTSCKYKHEIEKYIKEKYPDIQWEFRQLCVNLVRTRGWLYLRFKSISIK